MSLMRLQDTCPCAPRPPYRDLRGGGGACQRAAEGEGREQQGVRNTVSPLHIVQWTNAWMGFETR